GMVVVAAVLSYLPTFRGGFLLDDRPLVRNNPYVTRMHSLTSLLSQEDGVSTEGTNRSLTRTGYYRPLTNVTYWVDFRIWGMKAPGFRATNLFLHLLTCLVLFLLILRRTGGAGTAFWVTLLFALHPVNTESVSWISSRNNILAALFGLTCLTFFAEGMENGSVAFRFLSLLFFVLALLSKEFGILLPPLLFLYQWIVARKRAPFLRVAFDFAPYLLILGLYLVLRILVTDSLLPLPDGVPLLKRAAFAPWLVLLNTGLVLFPVGIHSFIVGYPSDLPGWQAPAGIAFLALVFVVVWRVRRQGLLCFSLIGFLASLLPVLHIVPIPAASLISLRWLYFPMTFLCLGLAPLVRALFRKRPFPTAGALCMATLAFGYSTFLLNQDLWKNEEVFFHREVRHFKNVFYAGGLAEVLFERGEAAQAEAWFRTALEKGFAGPKDRINYAALLTATDRPREALYILKGVEGRRIGIRERGEYHNNMGMALFRLGAQGEALNHFRKAVLFSPGEPLFWSNLGGAYGSIRDYPAAVSALQRGLETGQSGVGVRKNLAITYMRMEEYDKAVRVLEQIPHRERLGDGDVIRLLEEAKKGASGQRKTAGGTKRSLDADER
ncbi:MAG: tetratricopeptide repeat protein, partial [Deltaproteobacteria bacterium]|nr:tetratricopeptide repeat protein [Deltaproteobacteria bacterium]